MTLESPCYVLYESDLGWRVKRRLAAAQVVALYYDEQRAAHPNPSNPFHSVP